MNRLLLDGFKKVKFSIEIDVRDQVCLKIDDRLRNKIQMKFFSVAQVIDQFPTMFTSKFMIFIKLDNFLKYRFANEEANQSKGSIRQDVWNLMNPYKLGHINYELSQQIFATIME